MGNYILRCSKIGHRCTTGLIPEITDLNMPLDAYSTVVTVQWKTKLHTPAVIVSLKIRSVKLKHVREKWTGGKLAEV